MSETYLESFALAAIDRKIAHYRQAQKEAEDRSGDAMWAEIAEQRDHTATALEYLRADILAAAPDGDMITPPEPHKCELGVCSDETGECFLATPPEPVGVTREQVAFTVMLLDMDEEGDWPVDKVIEALGCINDQHSGDCTKMPWTCMKCRADRAYAIADSVIIALAKTEGADKP